MTLRGPKTARQNNFINSELYERVGVTITFFLQDNFSRSLSGTELSVSFRSKVVWVPLANQFRFVVPTRTTVLKRQDWTLRRPTWVVCSTKESEFKLVHLESLAYRITNNKVDHGSVLSGHTYRNVRSGTPKRVETKRSSELTCVLPSVSGLLTHKKRRQKDVSTIT